MSPFYIQQLELGEIRLELAVDFGDVAFGLRRLYSGGRLDLRLPTARDYGGSVN